MITDPIAVVSVLLLILAVLFSVNAHPKLSRLYKVIPMIVFAYFVPTLLSNLGILPLESAAYTFIKKILLPSSLVLLTLSVDIPGIVRLGPKLLIMFFGATFSIFVGSLLAYAIAGGLIPADQHAEAWKGLSALCASWIGGGANFVAVGESVGVSETMLGLIVVVDVAVASVWMAVLFYFAGKEVAMDQQIGADRKCVDELKEKIDTLQKSSARPINVSNLFQMLVLAIGGTSLLTWIAKFLPDIGSIINGFTWVVIMVTALGVMASFTRLRRLEESGASTVGSTFLYLLIATIGAQGNFKEIVNAPALAVVASVWMLFHAGFMLILRRKIKAPVFFLAVGSQANIGAAASAPIIASAFHPSLATVGVMLAILGYVLGTYLALVNAFFLQKIYLWLYAA